MEFILILVVLGLTVWLVVTLIAILSTKPSYVGPTKQKLCEVRVSDALRSIDFRSYVIFDNLILPSNGNTAHTEIDHVVVSPFGIFCIETKSHQGSIYGSENSAYWKQYLGNQEFKIYNPFRQNYKHTKALEVLLESEIKASLHSYVVFPNARKIKIDGSERIASIEEVVRQISQHKKQIYNLADCERILKKLAYASSMSAQLADIHKSEVQAYLNLKSV